MPSPQVTEHCREKETKKSHSGVFSISVISKSVAHFTHTWTHACAHLRPRPGPPLGRTQRLVTGSPGVRTRLCAVFAVHGLAGSVVLRLHALHHPGLVTKLPAGFAASAPLLHHPPGSTAGVRACQLFSWPVVSTG